HVGDALADVVDRVGQQEGDRPVGAGDDEVLQDGVLEHRLAAQQVHDGGLSLVGGAEPQGAAGAGVQPAVAAEPVVALVLVTGAGDDRLAAAVAVIGAAGVSEPLGGLGVLLGVGGLEVGALVLLAVHSEPGEGADDALGPLGAVAGCVGVLDPQDERPPR